MYLFVSVHTPLVLMSQAMKVDVMKEELRASTLNHWTISLALKSLPSQTGETRGWRDQQLTVFLQLPPTTGAVHKAP